MWAGSSAAPCAFSPSPASDGATPSTGHSTCSPRQACSPSPSAVSPSPISRCAATPDIEVRTLTDGGQTALEIAEWIAEFLSGARKTLDFALSALDREQPTGKLVGGALEDASRSGVAV